jgi:hypothetical protein
VQEKEMKYRCNSNGSRGNDDSLEHIAKIADYNITIENYPSHRAS